MGDRRGRGFGRWMTLLAAGMMTAVLAGCLSTSVKVWQADDFDSGGYVHYRWASAPLTTTEGVSPGMVAVDAAVRAEVDRAMSAKGYIEGEPAAFEIDYRVGGETQVSQPGPLSPRDMGERIRAGPNAEYEVSSAFTTHRVIDVLEIRKIKVTILDTGSQKMVWEGVASRPVDNADSSAKAVAKTVRTAVNKLMHRFPQARGPG